MEPSADVPVESNQREDPGPRRLELKTSGQSVNFRRRKRSDEPRRKRDRRKRLPGTSAATLESPNRVFSVPDRDRDPDPVFSVLKPKLDPVGNGLASEGKKTFFFSP